MSNGNKPTEARPHLTFSSRVPRFYEGSEILCVSQSGQVYRGIITAVKRTDTKSLVVLHIKTLPNGDLPPAPEAEQNDAQRLLDKLA